MELTNLLKPLKKAVKDGASLKRNCPKEALEKLVSSKACREGIEKLQAIGEGEDFQKLVGLAKNVVELYSDERWQISLVRQALNQPDPYVVSAANPMLGMCVAGEGKSRLAYYEIEGDVRALSTARDWSLKKSRTVTLEKGSLFDCNDPRKVMDFLELSQSHIFLRIVHKHVSPLLYAFSRETGKFAYITFSDEIATGQFFFADLILQMFSEPDCRATIGAGQMKDYIAFFNTQLANDSLAMKTKWRLLQSLGLVAEEDTVKWLERFSKHPDPGVNQLARETLARVSKHG